MNRLNKLLANKPFITTSASVCLLSLKKKNMVGSRETALLEYSLKNLSLIGVVQCKKWLKIPTFSIHSTGSFHMGHHSIVFVTASMSRFLNLILQSSTDTIESNFDLYLVKV